MCEGLQGDFEIFVFPFDSLAFHHPYLCFKSYAYKACFSIKSQCTSFLLTGTLPSPDPAAEPEVNPSHVHDGRRHSIRHKDLNCRMCISHTVCISHRFIMMKELYGIPGIRGIYGIPYQGHICIFLCSNILGHTRLMPQRFSPQLPYPLRLSI